MKKEKVHIMKKIEHLEDIILELENWNVGDEIKSSTTKKVGKIDSEIQRDTIVSLLKENISLIRSSRPDDNKLYLSDIIKKEEVKFGSNNLILAPVGSGKTTFIKTLIKNKTDKMLMLVSNTTLKNSLCPEDDELREALGGKMHTTQNMKMYGEEKYEIHVMSYAEFGNKIKSNNDFVKAFSIIFCDEIHSLPAYQQFENSVELSHAIKYVFGKYDDKQIFYFTATDENLDALERRQPGIMQNVKTFNYLNHPDIKQYMALSEYKINYIEQIRPHLKARIKSFNYFGYKCLAFNRTITGQKRIAEIAEEEGFKPLVIWSVNNSDEELQMTDEQLRAREYLLTNGEIPTPYNFLIINSAMQEGWNLTDERVKLAIMNTTNKTEKVQALGRLRDDVDILVYRIDRNQEPDIYVNFPSEYLDTPLTTEMKKDLVGELNLLNANGRQVKWPTIKKSLERQGYYINESQSTINGKRVNVSKITI